MWLRSRESFFHDFRRTGIRNMPRGGVRERVAMLAGSKTRGVLDRYEIVNEEGRQEAAERIGKRDRKRMGTTTGTAGPL